MQTLSMGEPQDVEISLGTGRLLVLFFGLVMVCAVFFSLGFSLGKNSTPPTVAAGETMSAPAAAKPKAGNAAPSEAGTAPAGSNELTFFRSVEQKDANAQLAPAATPPAVSAAAAATPGPSATPTASAQEMPKPVPGYAVQVAAVTKQQDAEALVDALRKKNYPVFVLANSRGDKLFHVQVGPFTELKDAEAMRSRLTGDGYNPIVKK